MHGGLLIALALAGGLSAPVRGITVSTHRGGQDWGSDEVPEAFRELKALGANWVAIHPYARIGGDGSVWTRHADDETPPEHILRPIREAKAAGLKILIKPHLAYWGSPFDWRGEIGFETEEEWDRFFRDYEGFLRRIARWTRAADGLVIGTELRKTEGEEARWREIIRAVRTETDLPLTYAANWDDYERVGFWDALDVIGIQAYFPLTEEADTSAEAIASGWARWMKRLARFSRSQKKPILFTELGYNRSYDAPVRPWDYHTDGEGAREIQERCLRIALRSIESEPAVLGAFLWKWFLPPRRVGRNFQLASPGMQRVICESWRESWSRCDSGSP